MSKKDTKQLQAEAKKLLEKKQKKADNGDIIQKGSFNIPENEYNVHNHTPNEGLIK